MSSLIGKTVFITGAAQGLGAVYAEYFAIQKANVVVADINASGAESVAASITAQGGSATALALDVTSESSIEAAFSAVVEKFGHIDVLINNAGGVFGWSPADEITLDDWNKTIALCLTGTWLCSRAAIPIMKAAKAGRIINVVSTMLDRAFPVNLSHYVTAKGGVAGLTRALARELGSFGITVNAISPGVFVHKDNKDLVQPIADVIVKDQSIPRFGVPDDLVGALAFLASDESSYITGQILNIDGGWTFN